MQSLPIEQAEGHLAEIIAKMAPGEELVLTREEKAIARLISAAGEQPRPVAGRGKGKLTIHSDDDEHLRDFAEYMP
jgi:antitoxin (DNA-binding transcriptional repressor) of toxin-antitoxin stability system